MSAEAAALVASSTEMTGTSLRRLDRMLGSEEARGEYWLEGPPRSVYRVMGWQGRSIDDILAFWRNP